MKDNYYGSTVIGSYGRRMRDDRGRFMSNKPEEKVKNMMDMIHENYDKYRESSEMYAPKEMVSENLNDTLDLIVNLIVELKKNAKSPEERDLIKRYIMTINEV